MDSDLKRVHHAEEKERTSRMSETAAEVHTYTTPPSPLKSMLKGRLRSDTVVAQSIFRESVAEHGKARPWLFAKTPGSDDCVAPQMFRRMLKKFHHHRAQVEHDVELPEVLAAEEMERARRMSMASPGDATDLTGV